MGTDLQRLQQLNRHEDLETRSGPYDVNSKSIFPWRFFVERNGHNSCLTYTVQS